MLLCLPLLLPLLLLLLLLIIIITRPKPAYCRQGLAGVSLCASGAQLGINKNVIGIHFIIIYLSPSASKASDKGRQ